MNQLLTIAIASLTAGCVTVRGSELRRGERLETTQLDQAIDDVPSLVVENGVAHVQLARTTCTRWAETYAQVEHQEIAHPRYGKLIGGLSVMTVGGGLLVAGSKTDGPTSTILTADGVIMVVGGLVATMIFGVGKQIHETRDLPTAKRDREKKRACEDSSLAQRIALPWRLTAGGASHEGTTGADGELVLQPAMIAALDGVPLDAVVKAIALDGGLTFELVLGSAPPGRSKLSAREIPDDQWKRWSAMLAGKLPRELKPRWEGCRAIYGAGESAIKCVALPTRDPRVTEISGTLAPTEGGDYGATYVFEAKTGEAVVFHASLPAGARDWLGQIVELETGDVVAELFSTSEQLELAALLTRSGTYAVVLDATAAGDFRASFTRPRRRSTP